MEPNTAANEDVPTVSPLNSSPINSVKNSPAYKSPNLVGYTALGHGTITKAKLEKSPFTPKNIFAVVLLFSLALTFFSFIISKALPKKENIGVSPVATKPAAVSSPAEPPVTGARLATYNNLENRFSITHPSYVTEGGSPDDPLPIALELRYVEPAVEFKIGEEKPGWYIRISKRIEAKSGTTLKEFALERKLLTTEPVTELNLAGVAAINWRSAVFPQNYYLLDTGEGIFFIKSSIKSQNEELYQKSIDEILGTLKFLARPVDPNLGIVWTRHKYGDSWDIDIPESWQIRDEGASGGLVSVAGDYLGNTYQVAFSYPDFTDQPNSGLPDSLSGWVLGDLNKLSADTRAQAKTRELKVLQTQAQEVLNYFQPGSGELTHRLYVWKRNGRNPSRVVINQTSGELDSQKMQNLFERFVSGIH
jgi:hypothetical protein